ncbi:hypothetical protein VaNZ11_013673 [Volvox africanus]|uniref:Uncharacterized protein n=1 Tax=Volvox africanus TaxID=51714 RepID=A0ABQ5SGP0_9CHLO|nr:hypothetical protein VaNZ11_013673 [Volvox africanus]
MSDLTPSAAGEDESDGSSPTLRDFTAASHEVHMLASLTAAMIEAQTSDAPCAPTGLQDESRRSGEAGDAGDTGPSSPTGSVGENEQSGERSRSRRSTSYVRLRTTTTSSTTVTAAAGALLQRMRNPGMHATNRSGNGSQPNTIRAGHGMLLPDPPGVAPVGMTALRQHVEELSSQLKYARTKQETDGKLIKELEAENTRLKNLVDSAGEVSDAAAASLRELARSRRTVEDLRLETDTLQRRAQDAELRCEQLQQLLRDAELRLGDAEQRAATARVAQAERASARVEQALEAANERIQTVERRAARAEQVAAQEQARAADACQRASRAEIAAAEDHERALDAERRAARAEHLLEQLQEQTLELERQVARAEQLAGAEAGRIVDAERRAARAEQAVAQERERALAADRRAVSIEDEIGQARAFAAAADRRATIAEEAVDEERSRTEAAERRAARAEQAAEAAHQLALDAERRATRAAQALEEAERRAVRAEEAHGEALARAEEAERRAARAAQSLEAAEAHALEAERRVGRAEQAQQDALARASEIERRAIRAEQAQGETVADLERRLARTEQAMEDARAHAGEMEKRAGRAEQASQQDRQNAADAERQVARTQQALEQAQADVLAAQRRAARAEQAAEEARSKAEEAKTQAAQADAKATHAEQLLAQERERAQEEARHASRMEAASLQDQERAREAEERAVAAIARAQQAETRLAVAEGHTAALETRLQQALTYADAADARAVDAERRYDRLATDSRELHAAVLHLANNADAAALASPPKTRAQDKDHSPRHLSWHGASGGSRKTQDIDSMEQAHGVVRLVLTDTDNSRHGGNEMDGEAITAASTPGLTGPGTSTLSRLWADAYATPSPDPSSAGRDTRKGVEKMRPLRAGRMTADHARSHDGDRNRSAGSPPRGAHAAGPGSLELFIDGTCAMADELRHVRGELRSTCHELNDLRSRYTAACSRVQLLEEQVANVDKLQAKVEKLTSQARKAEHLSAELKVCRTQLAEMEGLQLDLRKAQAELGEAQGLRAALEDARAQLVEMDRVRSEARRVNALLQTVTRERDVARNELQDASAQAVSVAALKAQLQRLEAALAEAEHGREDARAANAAALGQQEKLRAQLLSAEEELGEALRRCARLQATADDVSHQRDRLQVALDGAEGALQTAEAERAVLAAAQERAKGKLQELGDLQDEARLLKSQLQEAVAAQRRAVHAEEQAKERVDESQKQIVALKAQLVQCSAAQAEAAVYKKQLDQALGQVQTMKVDLSAAADRLENHAQLQADFALAVERAEKAEAQLRNANEAALRTTEQVQQLQQELAEARRASVKYKEDLAASVSLASSRGSRVAELEHEVIILREKSYQLEVEVASMTTELHRLKADLASASNMIEEATSERNQLSKQLAESTKQQARSAAATSAAEERFRGDMQQLQVRLATLEAECRTLQHANGNLHDDLERARSEVLTLQGQLKEEHRHREEQSIECRRLQRELDTTTETLGQAQRSQRNAVVVTTELEQDLERLRSGHSELEAELQVANARVQRLQEDTRQLSDRNAELSQQLHNMSATVRQLEAENARLADGHATLTVEMEVRAAEARAARGEAAELAADRARLMAELQAVKADLGKPQSERSGRSRRPSVGVDPRITITGGGIPPVSEAHGSGAAAGTAHGSTRPLPLARQLADEFASPIPSPNGRSDNLQALLAVPIDTGALLSGTGDLSQYEALLAALDEEAQQLDEELAGKEASSSVLLQRMRATKQAITARMETLQAALQSARDAESEMRRQAADKDATIQRLQQQLAQLSGGAALVGGPNTPSAEVAVPAGAGGTPPSLGFGPGVLQGNTVISALRQDLDAAHERLRDAGRQLREAQQRAESAEAEARKQRNALADAQKEIARLKTELSANDRVLAEAESALVTLVGEKEALERKLDDARAAERRATETAEGLRLQVAAIQAQLDAASATSALVVAEALGNMVHDRGRNDLQTWDASTTCPTGNGRDERKQDNPKPGSVGAEPSSDPMPASGAAAPSASMPALKLRNLSGWRASEPGSPSTAQPGKARGPVCEALRTSDWDEKDAQALTSASFAARVQSKLIAHADMETGSGDSSAAVDGAEAGYAHGVAEAHAPTSPNESATDASGLASPTGLRSTVHGTGSTSSSITGQDTVFGRRASADAARVTDSGGTPPSSSPRSSLVRLLAPSIISPRPGPVHTPSSNSAAGLVLRARASWAEATANAANTGVIASATRSTSSPLSPSGLRSQTLTECSPADSGVVRKEAATAVTTATAGAVATRNLTGLPSLQRRSTRGSIIQVSVPPLSLRRLSSHHSGKSPSCPSQQATSSAEARNQFQASDVVDSVYMARPVASSDANAALQNSSFRLRSGSALGSPRRTLQEHGVSVMDSGDFQASSPAVSPGSAGGVGSPIISPRDAIGRRSICRAVEQAARVLTTSISSGPQGQSAEVLAEGGQLDAASPCADLSRGDGACTSSKNLSNVPPMLRDAFPSRLQQAHMPDVARMTHEDGSSSSIIFAGTAALPVASPIHGASARGVPTHPYHSVRGATVSPSCNNETINGEDYTGFGTSHTHAYPPMRASGMSIWASVGEAVVCGTYNSSKRPAPSGLHLNSSCDPRSPRKQANSREVTPASLRRAAGLDENASMLAKRLAAMDEALRAIGAA